MSRIKALLSVHTAYDEQGKTSVVSSTDRQLSLKSIRTVNRSGGSMDMGHLIKLSEASWSFGQIDDSAAPDFVDQSAAIKANTTLDLFTLTDDDGFLVQADRKFNLMGFEITQAETGTPVYEFTYYNGTTYVALTTIAVADLTNVASELYVFLAPLDWVIGTTPAVGGSSGKFSIRVRATTAPLTAVQTNELWVGQFLTFAEAITDNGSLDLDFSEAFEPFKLEGDQSLLPYFSTANANNLVEVFYQVGD